MRMKIFKIRGLGQGRNQIWPHILGMSTSGELNPLQNTR
jgi:hypothetical protein